VGDFLLNYFKLWFGGRKEKREEGGELSYEG
jgi:hypothetical protein